VKVTTSPGSAQNGSASRVNANGTTGGGGGGSGETKGEAEVKAEVEAKTEVKVEAKVEEVDGRPGLAAWVGEMVGRSSANTKSRRIAIGKGGSMAGNLPRIRQTRTTNRRTMRRLVATRGQGEAATLV
jgi:hypothetical protein